MSSHGLPGWVIEPLGVGRRRAGWSVVCLAGMAVFAAACGDRVDSTGPTSPTLAAPATSPAPPPVPEIAATARYRLVFDATWSAQTHQVDPPPNPHFSPLVGVTHNGEVSFWAEGALATDGIRLMAELGRTSPLDNEFKAEIALGRAETLVLGGGTSSPGSASVEFDVSRDRSLLTLVTMVAPSPDWFAGVTGYNLIQEGSWVDRRVIPLYPWDAGTDSGVSFLSPDQETRPRAPISRILSAPLAPAGQAAPLGTFTLTRIGGS